MKLGSIPRAPLLTQAIGIKGGKGNADALFMEDIPLPQPRGNEALVRVKAFGLNRMDLLQREGKYPVPPQAPSTMGVEFSGVIQGFGRDPEHDFKVGDHVFGLAYGGTLAYRQASRSVESCILCAHWSRDRRLCRVCYRLDEHADT